MEKEKSSKKELKYENPFKKLKIGEWVLWLSSVVAIVLAFCLTLPRDIPTLCASLIGVTALIFVSKGDPLGQILTIVFALFYSVVSFYFRYYGEMITYLCMTTPAAIIATITWFRNPSKESKNEVKVEKMSGKKWIILLTISIIVTVAFYFILRALNTTNLIFSTLSVLTSMIASFLVFFRSPYYGLAYSTNDIVLIVLWSLATKTNMAYLPMIICFCIFLINDIYGFFNWTKIRKKQNEKEEL